MTDAPKHLPPNLGDTFSAMLRQDLGFFVAKAAQTVMPGVEFLSNWHIDAMVYPIQQMIDGDLNRLIINVHPRMGKSLLASVALPMYLLMRNPALQIMCVSYSDQLATTLHNLSRSLGKDSWYQCLNPQLKFRGSSGSYSHLKDTDNILQTSANGYRMAKSFGSGATGEGADWLILDDPNDMALVSSEAYRNATNNVYDTSLATRLNNKDGRIFLVTQRGHRDDLSGHLMEKGGFKCVTIEAEATQDTIYHIGYGKTHLRKKGTLIEPRRFGPAEIAERRRDLGSAGFEAQYQQNPLPPEGNIFRRSWLNLVEEPPAPLQYVVVSGDIASTQGSGDYSAFLVWGYCNGKWYLLAAERQQLDFPRLVAFYREFDERYEPDFTVIEAAGVGKPFVDRMRELGMTHIDAAQVKGSKEERATAVTPLLEQGLVLIVKSMANRGPFEAELLAFPSGRHDDMVDAFTLALSRRTDLLRMANHHRRPIRKDLPKAKGILPTLRMVGLGQQEAPTPRQSYFQRNRDGFPF